MLPAARKPRRQGASGTAAAALHFNMGSGRESISMKLWQRLLIILPAGLVLGMVGSRFAQPVLNQRAGDRSSQATLQTTADRGDAQSSYPVQPEATTAYGGDYGHAPAWAAADNWSGDQTPYSDASTPTIGELDARQAELLADPEQQFATAPAPDPVARAARSVSQPPANIADADPADLSPEPRKADGEPAIW
jgi:hypothetical protein